MLFAICADRGAPGSTTAALALASARGLPAIVVEADPYGGDLAIRLRPDGKHPLAATPTVLSVAAGRSTERPRVPPSTPMRPLDLWRSGAHELSERVRVVPGFMSAEQAAAVSWPALASVLGLQTVPVFVDVGRIHTGSPSMPILTVADAVIAVCRGDMGSVHHLVERLEALAPAVAERTGRTPMFLPMVVAPNQHGSQLAQSVSQLLGASAVGPAVRYVSWLAWDPSACALLENGGDPWQKPLRKSPLMTSARTALRQVGLATGLEHSEPARANKRRGRAPERAAVEAPSNGASASSGPGPAPTAPTSTTVRTSYAWSRPVQANQARSESNGKEVR
jgi:hypothetical protein